MHQQAAVVPLPYTELKRPRAPRPANTNYKVTVVDLSEHLLLEGEAAGPNELGGGGEQEFEVEKTWLDKQVGTSFMLTQTRRRLIGDRERPAGKASHRGQAGRVRGGDG